MKWSFSSFLSIWFFASDIIMINAKKGLIMEINIGRSKTKHTSKEKFATIQQDVALSEEQQNSALPEGQQVGPLPEGQQDVKLSIPTVALKNVSEISKANQVSNESTAPSTDSQENNEAYDTLLVTVQQLLFSSLANTTKRSSLGHTLEHKLPNDSDNSNGETEEIIEAIKKVHTEKEALRQNVTQQNRCFPGSNGFGRDRKSGHNWGLPPVPANSGSGSPFPPNTCDEELGPDGQLGAIGGLHDGGQKTTNAPINVKDFFVGLSWNVFCKFQPNGYDCGQKGVVPVFYWDTKLEGCKTATIGDKCSANYNTFGTLKDCYISCRDDGPQKVDMSLLAPHVYCRLQRSFGDCDEYEPSFYYDVTERKCKGFSYSGCGGNPNRFNSTSTCAAVCQSVLDYKASDSDFDRALAVR